MSLRDIDEIEGKQIFNRESSRIKRKLITMSIGENEIRIQYDVYDDYHRLEIRDSISMLERDGEIIRQ